MPLFPPKFPAKAGPRSDFLPDEFRDAILQKGQDVTWQMTAVCPCGQKLDDVSTNFVFASPLGQKGVTGEARVACSVCAGRGWYQHSSQPIRVLIHDMSVNPRRFGVSGEYAKGRARVTFLPENKPALGDRLELTYSVQRIHESTRRKTAAVTQALRFPIVPQVLTTATGDQTVRVLQCMRAVDNVASGASALVEGVDFTVTAGGLLDWTLGDVTGRSPGVGQSFSITYFAHPRYVIEDVPFAVRDTNVHYKTPAPVSTQLPVFAIALQEYRGDGTNPGA